MTDYSLGDVPRRARAVNEARTKFREHTTVHSARRDHASKLYYSSPTAIRMAGARVSLGTDTRIYLASFIS